MKGLIAVPWSDEERDQLRRLHANGLGHKQISMLMGRSKDSVHRQLRRLGVVRSDRNTVRRDERLESVPRGVKVTLPPLPSLMDGDAS